MTWFETSDNSENKRKPIVLVHGVFGSGKSFMLVGIQIFCNGHKKNIGLIVFLCRLLDAAGINNSDAKILVCSSTNVAGKKKRGKKNNVLQVDRVLLGLLRSNFDAFVRVGSLKKINKAILAHTLQTSEGK